MNSARTAELASPFGGSSAFWASLMSSIGEVFAMLFAVARGAEGYSIRQVESKFWIIGPRFDVVRVQVGVASALLTGEPITSENQFSPASHTKAKPSTLTFQGVAVFPCRRLWPNQRTAGARLRAIHLVKTFKRAEFLATSRAILDHRRIAVAPTGLRTIFTCFKPVCFNFVWATAKMAGEFYLRVLHIDIIALHRNESKYIALERLAGMGLSPRLVSDAFGDQPGEGLAKRTVALQEVN